MGQIYSMRSPIDHN